MENIIKKPIVIYSDGSCNTLLKIGAWVSILFVDADKIILKGIVTDTTNNRMELTAAIQSLQYLIKNNLTQNEIGIYTDSQYLVTLPARIEKLKRNNFRSSKGNQIQNTDLIIQLAEVLDKVKVIFVKIVAHQKKSAEADYNREADMLARKLLRETIKGKTDVNKF